MLINAHWLYCEPMHGRQRVIGGLEYQMFLMSKHFAVSTADYLYVLITVAVLVKGLGFLESWWAKTETASSLFETNPN